MLAGQRHAWLRTCSVAGIINFERVCLCAHVYAYVSADFTIVSNNVESECRISAESEHRVSIKQCRMQYRIQCRIVSVELTMVIT